MAPADIITLDNLREKLPPWSPDEPSHLYAVVDMGSNGIRFSITSLAPPRARLLAPVYSQRASISLFDALTPDASGGLVFPPSVISSVSSTVSNFIRIATLHNVPRSNIMIFATEAMRRAANAVDMLEAIAKATNGLHVSILEPAVETLFGAVMGSRSGLVDVKNGALFLDLGGGSVQLTWVDTSLEDYEFKAARAGISMPFGAAKLSRILDNETKEVQTMEKGKLKTSMLSAYDNLCRTFPKLAAARNAHQNGQEGRVDVFMCGGGFRGYGSILMHDDETKPYPISSIGTYTVEAKAFTDVDGMRRINDTYDGKIFGMSRRRRHQFNAIATVIEAFTSAVPNIRHVTFCKGSNKEGALMMKLPLQIRESNPLGVLASPSDLERQWYDAVLRKIREAVPGNVDLSHVPTVFDDGICYLFAREIWSRAGHEADTNTSFALHNSITRDSDTPGLSHLARSVIGLTLVARWGSSTSPADAGLAEGLRGILKKHDDAVFWAYYIGTVAYVLATVLPVKLKDASSLDSLVKFDAQMKHKEDKKDKIELAIQIAPEYLEAFNSEDLSAMLNATFKNEKKKAKKVHVVISSL